jgi:hypothetical protein
MGNYFTELLPSNGRRDAHADTETDERVYEICCFDEPR